jgi:hypothetical protein
MTDALRDFTPDVPHGANLRARDQARAILLELFFSETQHALKREMCLKCKPGNR